MKLNTYIGVITSTDPNYITYVTDVVNRSAIWESGKPARKFSDAIAKEIVFGLNVNGYSAVVIKAPVFVELKNENK